MASALGWTGQVCFMGMWSRIEVSFLPFGLAHHAPACRPSHQMTRRGTASDNSRKALLRFKTCPGHGTTAEVIEGQEIRGSRRVDETYRLLQFQLRSWRYRDAAAWLTKTTRFRARPRAHRPKAQPLGAKDYCECRVRSTTTSAKSNFDTARAGQL